MDRGDPDKIDPDKVDLDKIDLDKVDRDTFDPDIQIREGRAQLFPPEYFLNDCTGQFSGQTGLKFEVRILPASAALWTYRPLLAIRKTPIRHRIGRASKKNPMK